ncbi:hypothetical protein ACH4SP_05015 [Streptomyces sp. NPDC021093]|uniref:hypothetical protein n=1 Tax=Streptomyces sp. NPDC021093 TaxID=3365112 RepID=UPI0037B07097
MAMTEAILAMASGLGGAGIGAGGALWVQRAKRRDDAASAAAARADTALAVEVVATTRAAARAWWTNVQRVLVSLEAERAVDAQQYEEQVRAELREFTTALYRIPGIAHPHDGVPVLLQRPWADLMTHVSLRLVEAAHGQTTGIVETARLGELREEGQAVHSAIAAYLVKCTERLGQNSVPAVPYGLPYGYPVPANDGRSS